MIDRALRASQALGAARYPAAHDARLPRPHLLWATLLLVACASDGSSRGLTRWWSPARCPVHLVDSARIPDGPLLRQRIRIRNLRDGREISLELAVQIQNQTVTLVGLTPFGTRAFAIVQQGKDYQVDDLAGERLGIRPVWLLDALHRSRWITAPPNQDGQVVSRWLWMDESVTQASDEQGAPRLRRFRRHDSKERSSSDGEVLIEYRPADNAAGQLQVHNPWCGYAASIDSS